MKCKNVLCCLYDKESEYNCFSVLINGSLDVRNCKQRKTFNRIDKKMKDNIIYSKNIWKTEIKKMKKT